MSIASNALRTAQKLKSIAPDQLHVVGDSHRERQDAITAGQDEHLIA
ncbi:hypothetical protein [Hydrocarboniphaga effusa]|jgi:hypothetical protein